MSTYLFKNATLMTFFPPRIEQGDLRIAGGKIVERAARLSEEEQDCAIDLTGKILMPGMVCAHTHLYSALSRGMPGPEEPPSNFPEILEKVWWRLDKALDAESIYYSTGVGILDAIASGTTTLIDHHASPGCLAGSLKMMKEVFEEIGMRGVLCYEVTDRGGSRERDLGVAENQWILEQQSDLVRGLVGAHAGFTLSDDSLGLCAELMQTYNSGLHIHVAEDLCDVDASLERYGKPLIQRLNDAGVLNDKSVLAHGVHLSPDEMRQIQELGCWLVHNPRSNMNNAVGYAPLAQFGPKSALGTDGIGSNMFEEAKFMYFKAQDAGGAVTADDCLRFLAGGQQLAATMFGLPIGTLDKGAAADLVVVDYPSPTPLYTENLAWHFIFGLTHAQVESVMVAGKFLLRDRQFVDPELYTFYQEAQEVASRLWSSMKAS